MLYKIISINPDNGDKSLIAISKSKDIANKYKDYLIKKNSNLYPVFHRDFDIKEILEDDDILKLIKW